MSDRITLKDCKRAGFCLNGVEAFVERSGVSFRQFAREGISVEAAQQMDGWAAMVEHILRVRAGRGEEV